MDKHIHLNVHGKIPVCGDSSHTVMYSAKYDAYYCIECNFWLESFCSDHECEFCKDRPPYPLGGTYG